MPDDMSGHYRDVEPVGTLHPDDAGRLAESLLPVNARTGEVVVRPLVDDLADVLARTVVGWANIIGVDHGPLPSRARRALRCRMNRSGPRASRTIG